MKYKGKERKEITTQQIVDPPREMLVWADEMVKMTEEPHKEIVYAVVKLGKYYVAITSSHQWDFCAEIPEDPKPRRATSRELAKWLAIGIGEWCMKNGTGRIGANTNYGYSEYEENQNVDDGVLVRKWEDTDWHEPTVDYMGIE